MLSLLYCGALYFKTVDKAPYMLKLMFSVHNDNDQSLTRLERLLAIFRAKAAEQQLILEKHVTRAQHGIFYRNIESL